MAAVTFCPPPSPPTPFRLRSSRPTARSSPSAAVRRRRAVCTLVVLAALGILLGAGSLAGAGQASVTSSGTSSVTSSGASAGVRLDARPVASSVHVVQPGDTLWILARRIQPEGDVRPLVARLQAVHGPGPLLPGEAVRLAV